MLPCVSVLGQLQRGCLLHTSLTGRVWCICALVKGLVSQCSECPQGLVRVPFDRMLLMSCACQQNKIVHEANSLTTIDLARLPLSFRVSLMAPHDQCRISSGTVAVEYFKSSSSVLLQTTHSVNFSVVVVEIALLIVTLGCIHALLRRHTRCCTRSWSEEISPT